MHHVAIMKKSWGLIPKIISRQKTIESRWYQTRRAPWNKIKIGDAVFFKNSGEEITAKASVCKVVQFEIHTITDIVKIIKKYGERICLINDNPRTWKRLAKYCILIFLKNPKKIKPFAIDKKGFGMSNAWITLPNIKNIQKR